MPTNQIPTRRPVEFIVDERLSKVAAFSLWALVALISVLQIGAQPAAQLTLIKAARLVDPRSGNVFAPAAVLIEGDKIKQVGSPVSASAGTRVVDLGNATLLPGLIDSHTHLLLDVVVPPEAEIQRHS